MAETNLTIHGKSYGVACDDGQERRVAELGRYVDSRLREIAGAGAASTESHLLVLTGLVLADEIYELREALQGMERHINSLSGTIRQQQHQLEKAGESAADPEEEEEILSAIDHLAARIDSVAARLMKI